LGTPFAKNQGHSAKTRPVRFDGGVGRELRPFIESEHESVELTERDVVFAAVARPTETLLVEPSRTSQIPDTERQRSQTLVRQRSHGVKVMPIRIPSGLNMRVTV
jgi:hypothetical protein